MAEKTIGEEVRKLTLETPQYHVKPDGTICSSLLVNENDEPCYLPCDCGLDELIGEIVDRARRELAEGVMKAVEKLDGHKGQARRLMIQVLNPYLQSVGAVEADEPKVGV
jgi:hypothetical protein